MFSGIKAAASAWQGKTNLVLIRWNTQAAEIGSYYQAQGGKGRLPEASEAADTRRSLYGNSEPIG